MPNCRDGEAKRDGEVKRCGEVKRAPDGEVNRPDVVGFSRRDGEGRRWYGEACRIDNGEGCREIDAWATFASVAFSSCGFSAKFSIMAASNNCNS